MASPDIVLIVIDTWRWDALGANGEARPGLTPHLDELAERGVLFSRAVATSPWTEPSVASMLTGEYPTVHGAHGLLADVAPIHPEVPTLPEILSEAGYRTLGVVNNYFLSPELGFERGFDTYDYAAAASLELRRAAETVDVALRHVAAVPDEPLFLLLHLFDPHLAYDPPEGWRQWVDDYQGPFADLPSMRQGTLDTSPEAIARLRGLYDGEVAYVDAQIGRFLEALDEARPGRRRFLVVTSDHGEEFGEHGRWEHGHALYQELVKVPLIVVPADGGSGEEGRAGETIEAQVPLLDLMPTLLQVAGIEPPPQISGRSILPWLTGESEPEPRVAISERVHLGPESVALRKGRWSLITFPKARKWQLFDQVSDPIEKRNLSRHQPEEAARLKAELWSLMEVLSKRAEQLGPGGDRGEIAPDDLERLLSLGYVGG